LEVRVRVGLRNDLGRDPTMEELRNADVNQYENISINLIKEAFVSGKEVSSTLMMCNTYPDFVGSKLIYGA
jgi:hypothetical protein